MQMSKYAKTSHSQLLHAPTGTMHNLIRQPRVSADVRKLHKHQKYGWAFKFRLLIKTLSDKQKYIVPLKTIEKDI